MKATSTSAMGDDDNETTRKSLGNGYVVLLCLVGGKGRGGNGRESEGLNILCLA